jgi:uncharacterized protein (UPF0212 family)
VSGTNYATCPTCFQAIEAIWLADWHALLAQEQITPGSPDEIVLAEVVMAESERHPWTAVDIAMTLLTCPECGHELGSRYQECTPCYQAFGKALASEFGVTANEHALHIGRWVLRHPHQHSANAVAAWSRTTPRILTGWLPSRTDAQRTMALIKQGRLDEVDAGLAVVDGEIKRLRDW